MIKVKKSLALLIVFFMILSNVAFAESADSSEISSDDRTKVLCKSDSDCTLKKQPYCCGENLEFIAACYHVDEHPPTSKDCSGNNLCPGFAPIEACKCVNNACAPIFRNNDRTSVPSPSSSSNFMETVSKQNDMMERFNKGDISEGEMRSMAKEKLGDKFNEMEFKKNMLQSKERMDRKDAFSYEHGGLKNNYNAGPSYEGYSKEHMIFGMVFGLIGDDIDPREIKQYCNDPNKIADIIIGKLKEKVGDLQNVCSRFDEQESKCLEYSKKGCSQIGIPFVREGATEREKLEAVAFSCPPNKDAIIEVCKKRGKYYMEQRLENLDEECKKRFEFSGERLLKECEIFKQQVVCDKEKYISQCMGGIKKEDFEEKNETQCKITGCSSQVCSENDLVTTCEYMPEYDCYKFYGKCAKQSDGRCGWTQSNELLNCIKEKQITRVVTCPIPVCAMPPAGCKYVSDDQKGLDGCPLYPCGKLSCETLSECKITGCSSQVCSENDVMTTCEYRPEYECYKLYGKCEKQSDGRCGWTQSDVLFNCIKEKTSVTSCPDVLKPKCSQDQNLVSKVDDKNCVTSYECVTVATNNSITGGVIASTYEDMLGSCENRWVEQQRTCQNMPNVCDKEKFIEKCKEQEKRNNNEFVSQIEIRCQSEATSQIRHVEEACARREKDRQRCIEESAKRCEQMKGLAEQCMTLLTEENLREFIIKEAKKRCKFTDIIEEEDDVRQADKVDIILAVLNTITEDDINKLELYVQDLKEELKLQDTTVYKGTIAPNRFGDIKLLPFVVNAKISTHVSSERSKEVKAKIVASQHVEEAASKLISLRDSDVPDEYLYIIEDKANDVLNVSDTLNRLEEKEEQKGLGYKIRLFLGLAKKAEQEEIKQLEESKAKLQTSIDTLTKLADEVPSDVANAILKEQVESLKKQQEDIKVLIETKEKKSKGLFGIFG